jgi:heterotetrameric sarcosine oxidase gamma subunit
MYVSAPERALIAGGATLRLSECAADVVELVALRGRATLLADIARGQGCPLPARGRILRGAATLVVAARPERWLVLSAPAACGERAALWQSACTGSAAVVDLSSALAVLQVSGAAAAQPLARGCRLDLDPGAFPPGSAAATLIAQVSVVLAALDSGFLLLTPSTTARHVREWLLESGAPFGLQRGAGVTVAQL